MQDELPLEQRAIDTVFDAIETTCERLEDRIENPQGTNKADVRAARNEAQGELEHLRGIDDPIFGRLTFDDGETFVVGETVIYDAERHPLMINWRAKKAAPYFLSSPEDHMGLRLRRQFRIHGRTLVAYEDRLDLRPERPTTTSKLPDRDATPTEVVEPPLPAASGAKTPEPATAAPTSEAQPPHRSDEDQTEGEVTAPVPTPAYGELNDEEPSDFLLDELKKKRSGEMEQIVATIQREQFLALRTEPNRVLVIQGGPGTGKTVIGLHRASWILFNELQRETSAVAVNEQPMLVVGPTTSFIDYIRNVLPKLGDRGVAHRAITAFGDDVDAAVEDSLQTTQIKGQARMAGLLDRGLRNRIVIPSEGVALGGPDNLVIPHGELEELRSQVDGSTYNGGRSSFLGTLHQRYDPATKDAHKIIERAVNRIWPKLTAQEFLSQFFGNADQLLEASEDAFSVADLNALRRPTPGRIKEAVWSTADRPLLDHVAARIDGAPRIYRHMIVDEAQDLSPMQLRMLGRRSLTGAFTVLGDIAQSTGLWARSSWDDVVEHLESDLESTVLTLEIGYRVPSEIMKLANALLPAIAPGVAIPSSVRAEGVAPRFERVRPEPSGALDPMALAFATVSAIEELRSGAFGIGVIAQEAELTHIREVLTELEIAWSSPDAPLGLHAEVVTLTPAEAKGLEFDATVVVDPHGIVESGADGGRLLYIALTRPIRRLTVVYSGTSPLPNLEPLPSDVDPPTSLPEVESVEATRTSEDLAWLEPWAVALAGEVQDLVARGASADLLTNSIYAILRFGRSLFQNSSSDDRDEGDDGNRGLPSGNGGGRPPGGGNPASVAADPDDESLEELNRAFSVYYDQMESRAKDALKGGLFVALTGDRATFQVSSPDQLRRAQAWRTLLNFTLQSILGRRATVEVSTPPQLF